MLSMPTLPLGIRPNESYGQASLCQYTATTGACKAAGLGGGRGITSRFRKGTVPFSLRENWDSPQVVFRPPRSIVRGEEIECLLLDSPVPAIRLNSVTFGRDVRRVRQPERPGLEVALFELE